MTEFDKSIISNVIARSPKSDVQTRNRRKIQKLEKKGKTHGFHRNCFLFPMLEWQQYVETIGQPHRERDRLNLFIIFASTLLETPTKFDFRTNSEIQKLVEIVGSNFLHILNGLKFDDLDTVTSGQHDLTWYKSNNKFSIDYLGINFLQLFETNESNDENVVLYRKYCLYIVHLLSYLSSDMEHRAHIYNQFGANLFKMLIVVVKFIVSKMEDYVIILSDNSCVISDQQYLDGYFTLSFLVGMIQFCSHNTRINESIVQEFSTCILPNQPWTFSNCKTMGFDLCGDDETHISLLSDEDIIIAVHNQNRSRTSQNTKQYKPETTQICRRITAELAELETIEMLLSVLRKLSYLVRSLPAKCNENNLFIKKIKKYSYLLQTEVLFAIASLFDSQQLSTLIKYRQSGGSHAIQTLLLMERSDEEVGFTFASALISLRLNVLLLSTTSFLAPGDVTNLKGIEDDFLLILNSIGPFSLWLQGLDKYPLQFPPILTSCRSVCPTSITANSLPSFNINTNKWPWDSPDAPVNTKDRKFWNSSLTDVVRLFENRRLNEPVISEFDDTKYFVLASLKMSSFLSIDDISSGATTAPDDSNILNAVSGTFLSNIHCAMCQEFFEVIFQCSSIVAYEGNNTSTTKGKNMNRLEYILTAIKTIVAVFVPKQTPSKGTSSDEKQASSYVGNVTFQISFVQFLARFIVNFKDDAIYLLSTEDVFNDIFLKSSFLMKNVIISDGFFDMKVLKAAASEEFQIIWKCNEATESVPATQEDSENSRFIDYSRRNYKEQHFYNAANILHDMCFELLWIVTMNLCKNMKQVEEEAKKDLKPVADITVIVTKFVATKYSDEINIRAINWLRNIHTHFMNNKPHPINLHAWPIILAKCISLCDTHMNIVNSITATAKSSIDIFTLSMKRPFFWPCRIGLVELICKLVTKISSRSTWIEAFLPKDFPKLGGHESLATGVSSQLNWKSQKHFIAIKLLLDPWCFNASEFIINRILIIVLILTQPKATNTSSDSEKSSIYSALGHDIIKILFRLLKRNVRSLTGNCTIDDHPLVQIVFKLLINFLHINESNCIELAKLSEGSHLNSVKRFLPHIVFDSYGIMDVYHQYFYWTQNKSSVYEEVYLLLQDCAPKYSNDKLNTLICHILTLYNSLMCDNHSNKELFRSVMLQRSSTAIVDDKNLFLGRVCKHHSLAALLISPNSTVTEQHEIFLILIEMLLEGFQNPDPHPKVLLANDVRRDGLFNPQTVTDLPVIKNVNAFLLIIPMIPNCHESVQVYIFSTILNLVTSANAIANLAKCTLQPSVIELVLDIFPLLNKHLQHMAIKLVVTIGKYDISVADLKRMFRLLQSTSNNMYRPKYTSIILEALEAMISTNPHRSPKYYFSLQGSNSALALPPLKKFPPVKNGYSFSIWFELLPPSLVSASYRTSFGGDNVCSRNGINNPVLLCLRQDRDGMGIEVSFEYDDQITFNSYHVLITRFDKDDKVLQQLRLPVITKYSNNSTPEPWHHFAYSHVVSTNWSKSEIIVCLDGSVTREKISYTRFTESISYPTVGRRANYRVGTKSTSSTVPSSATNMCGNVSSIYFFSDALSEAQLVNIYKLGCENTKLISENDDRADRAVQSCIMLAQEAGVSSGDTFVDNTPVKNAVKWNNSYTTQKLNGTCKCTVKDIRDALDCLGGLKVLIPIFLQIDLPMEPSDELEVPSTQANKLCIRLVRSIFLLLRDSPENHQLIDTDTNNIFSLIGYFLERISPENLSLELFDIVIEGVESLSWNTAWQDNILKNIIVNFKLWIFSPIAIQKKLFNYLREYVSKYETRSLALLSVNKLFDALQFYYCSAAISRLWDEDLYQHGAKRCRLTEEEIDYMRAKIFHILYVQLSSQSKLNGGLNEEVAALVHYISFETSVKYKIEGMQLLFRVLKYDGNNKLGEHVLHAICNKNLSTELLGFINHSKVKLRLYALVCLCSILQLMLIYTNDTEKDVKKAGYSSFIMKDTGHNRDSVNNLGVVDLDDSSQVLVPFAYYAGIGIATPGVGKTPPMDTDTPALPTSSSNDDLAEITQKSASSDYAEQLIGVSYSKFEYLFRFITEELIKHIKDDTSLSLDKSSSKQYQIVFLALYLLMHGKLFVNNFDTNVPLTPGKVVLDDNQSVLLRLQNFIETINTAASDANDPVEVVDFSEFQTTLSYVSQFAICLPSLFPALLQFINNDCVPEYFRVLCIKNLNDSFKDNFENSDIILGTSHCMWQSSFFTYIITEYQRIVTLKERLYIASSESSDYVCELTTRQTAAQQSYDIIIDLLLKIHLHVVLAGVPGIISSSYSYGKPRLAKNMDLKSLKDWKVLLCSKRSTHGITIMRETMSFIRYYAMEGYSDANNLGIKLLQATITGMAEASEYLALNGAANEYEFKEIRSRWLNLHHWLMAAEVLEFITIPPTQGERKRRVSSNGSGGSGSFSSDFSNTSGHGASGLGSSSHGTADMADSRYSTSMSKTHRSASAPAIPSNLLTEFKSVATDAASGVSSEEVVISRDSHAGRVRGSSSVFDNQDKHHRSNSTSALPSKSSHMIYTNKIEHQADEVWLLINSMLRLIGSFDLYSNAWLPATSNIYKLRMGLKVGFTVGRGIMGQANEAVDKLISTSHLPATPVKGESNPGNSVSDAATRRGSQSSTIVSFNKETPLSKAIDGVLWILLRVLLNIFVNADSNHEVIHSTSHSIQALNQLVILMDFLKQKSKEIYDIESLYLLAHLSTALFNSRQPMHSMWIKELFKFLANLLINQKSELGLRLNSINNLRNTIAAAADGVTEDTGISPVRGPSPSITSTTSTATKAAVPSVTSEIERVCEYVDNYCAGKSDSDSLDNIPFFMNLIQLCLCCDSDATRVTWDTWAELISPIIDSSKKIERDISNSRVTDNGLYKHSLELKGLLERKNKDYEHFLMRFSSKISQLQQSISHIDHENFSLKNYYKSEESNRRKKLKEVDAILQELSNERGPWANNRAFDDSDVLWMIDTNENEMHMKVKLLRNPNGSRHLSASELSKCESITQSNANNAVENGVSTSNKSLELPELWRNLGKYKSSQASTHMDHNASEEEEDEEDETDDSNLAANSATANNNKEISLYMKDCEIISPSTNTLNLPAAGTLEVTKRRIVFTSKTEAKANPLNPNGMPSTRAHNELYLAVAKEISWATEPYQSSTWYTNDITNAFLRHYQLRDVAVEIFFVSRSSVFINLHDKESAMLLFSVLRKKVKPVLFDKVKPNSASLLRMYTDMWQSRDISNFEYLMRLNTLAGRTFNDLGQYPVFPWILSDYTSPTLNLKDKRVFRDLRWPIGAQHEEQRELIMAKYNDLASLHEPNNATSLPPFHFGSHYSVAGFVLWYLMRLEPYTSLHIQLQDGRFDKPDRLFSSLEAAWRGCTSNPADVKELIPEMFYCPEMFQNINNLKLGQTQTGQPIDNVTLPPWAKDPYDFVIKHRKALESEYVSENLHHWIDLIFGYKQRPPHLGGDPACVASCNVFFHLTYANAVNLDELRSDDEHLYRQYISQISEFGQTPCQLFTKPHPARTPLREVEMIWSIASSSSAFGADTLQDGPPLEKPSCVTSFKGYEVSINPVIFIGLIGDKMITVDSGRILGKHYWQPLSPDIVPPFKFKQDRVALEISKGQYTSSSFSSLMKSSYSASSSANRERLIGVALASSLQGIAQEEYELRRKMTRESDGGSAEPADHNTMKLLPRWKPQDKDKYEDRENKYVLFKNNHAKNASSTPTTPVRANEDATSASSIQQSSAAARVRSFSDFPIQNNTRAISTDQSNRSLITSHVTRHKTVLGPAAAANKKMSLTQLYAVVNSSKLGPLIISCGHWDNSFRVTSIETCKVVQVVNAHSDIVTCLTVAREKEYNLSWLITGSKDCTVKIWLLDLADEGNCFVPSQPIHVLYGHNDTITTIASDPSFDLVVSGSDDGTIILHTLREGAYIRSIITDNSMNVKASSDEDSQENHPSLPQVRSIAWVGISVAGYVVGYSAEENIVFTYTINGLFVASSYMQESIYAMKVSEDGMVLISGGSSCLVVLRWVQTLELAKDGPRQGLKAVIDGSDEKDNKTHKFNSPIRSITLTAPREMHLIVGLESGEVRVLAQDSDYLRTRLQRKLQEIGIL